MKNRRKSWSPHRTSKNFIKAIEPAVRAISGKKDRCNVIIFCGAGFAKAWSVKSPLAKDLFSDSTEAFHGNESLFRLLDYLRKGDSGYLTQDALKEVTSFLNLCDHHHFLLGNPMDPYSTGRLKMELARAIKDYFRTLHYINYVRNSTGLLPVNSQKKSTPKTYNSVFDSVASRQLRIHARS